MNIISSTETNKYYISASSCTVGLYVIITGSGGTGQNDGMPPLDFVVKQSFQLRNEAPSLLSQHVWAAQEQRQKAWEIIWELVPKCVAILGPRFRTAQEKTLKGKVEDNRIGQ